MSRHSRGLRRAEFLLNAGKLLRPERMRQRLRIDENKGLRRNLRGNRDGLQRCDLGLRNRASELHSQLCRCERRV
jgi:hypothetical protein